MCICPEGYTQVGMTDDCRDVNECAANGNLCKNGHCVNTKGSYKCECYEGFEVSSDGKSCIGNFSLSFKFSIHLTFLSMDQIVELDIASVN
jgi:hypothetical protein